MDNNIEWCEYSHGCLDEKENIFHSLENEDSIRVQLKTNKENIHIGFYNRASKVLVGITDSLGNNLEQDDSIIFSENSEWVDEDIVVTHWRPYIDGDVINEIIESLQGTTQTLSDACDYYDIDDMDLTSDQHNQIDNEIFLCSECGWWCEISESSECEDEQMCEDCYDE